MYEGKEIIPLQFLKAVLPDPSSLGPRTKAKPTLAASSAAKKDGKDKIEPTFVGEKVRVIMADDGAILISKTKKDLVTKVDKKGKIVWSIDAKYSILNNSDDAYYDSANNNINGLQVINGNYVLSYNGDDGSQKDENEYNFGVGTCYLVLTRTETSFLKSLKKKRLTTAMTRKPIPKIMTTTTKRTINKEKI